MAEQLIYACKLKEGIHARPAGHIERLCNTFSADISWSNSRTGITANAKSALALVGTDTLFQDECKITLSGDDEFDACVQLADLLEKICLQEETHTEETPDVDLSLPRTLRETHPVYIRGTRISGGIAIARSVVSKSITFCQLESLAPVGYLGEKAELALFQQGIENLKNEKVTQLENACGVERDIIEAHLSIVNDITFAGQVTEYICQQHNAFSAVISAAIAFCDILNNSSSKYIKERVLDVMDITLQLLSKINSDIHLPHSRIELVESSILVADSLTPGKFMALDKTRLAGMVLSNTGKTSHTAILARSLGIPTITDLDDNAPSFDPDELMVLDGNLGLLIPSPTNAVLRYYQSDIDAKTQKQKQMLAQVINPATTADGRRIEVAANIGGDLEAARAFSNGAEGIGLFRTELAFMDRAVPPTEDELTQQYIDVIKHANNQPVIFRTIDIGGDKPLEYLNIQPEENPFLGYRAIRIYPEFITLFKTQLSAILRASASGYARIMIPMIASVEEVVWCREVLESVKIDLRANHIKFDENIEMGVMLEVPSVLFAVPEIARHADFFSVGSNDLTQYLFAADRGNTRVEHVYDNFSPAFLRALKFAVDEVHRQGRWIGICGELAANLQLLPLLIGMGFDELSMSSAAIPTIKSEIASMKQEQCGDLLQQALALGSSAEVRQILENPNVKITTSLPIISESCILNNLDLQNRNEVIKMLTDNLWLQDRTHNPEKLAEDVWAREDSFPTAVGYGFAIPHTKSDFITNSTISIAKLQKPIQWGEQQVNIIIMLTIRKSSTDNEHMKYFSQLARKIMNEDFRNEISRSNTKNDIYKVVAQAISTAI